MASSGDAGSAFEQIAAGTATGLGIDRGEAIGTGGLSSGEDRDEVAEGDSWRQHFEREPFSEDQSTERFEPSGGRPGWRTAGGLEGEDPAWLEPEDDDGRDEDR